MHTIFQKVLNRSIDAGYLILAIFVIRMIFRKTPKWMICLMWGLVGFRLICPITLTSTLGLLPSKESVNRAAVKVLPRQVSKVNSVSYQGNKEITAMMPTPHTNSLPSAMDIIKCVWVAGMIILLLYSVFTYIKLHNRVKISLSIQENIRICDDIETSFILGTFKPVIYLSSSITEQELEHIMAHEQAHLSRLDHLWKPIGFAILTVYWFHPLCWLAYILFCRDIEYACDEKVIREYGKKECVSYSETLLNCSLGRKNQFIYPLAFGEVGVKERVKHVLNYKKPKSFIIVLSLIGLLFVGLCFTANSKAEKSKRQEELYTPYIGDASAVTAIAQNLPYPEGYSYASVKLQTDKEPYELVVFLDSEKSVEGADFQACAEKAFEQIDNLDIVTFSRSYEDHVVYSFSKQKYYLTIGEENVCFVEVSSTENNSSGCTVADGNTFKKGEKVWLEALDGLKDLSGVTIIGKAADGKVIRSISVPTGKKELSIGDWKITSKKESTCTGNLYSIDNITTADQYDISSQANSESVTEVTEQETYPKQVGNDRDVICEAEEGKYQISNQKEYEKAGLVMKEAKPGDGFSSWYYGNLPVAGLYDGSSVYTNDQGNVFLEVLRNKNDEIQEIREITKEQFQDLMPDGFIIK